MHVISAYKTNLNDAMPSIKSELSLNYMICNEQKTCNYVVAKYTHKIKALNIQFQIQFQISREALEHFQILSGALQPFQFFFRSPGAVSNSVRSTGALPNYVSLSKFCPEPQNLYQNLDFRIYMIVQVWNWAVKHGKSEMDSEVLRARVHNKHIQTFWMEGRNNLLIEKRIYQTRSGPSEKGSTFPLWFP